MNCCTNCFNDKEIIGFILDNSTEISACDFCGSLNVQIIETRELEEQFQPLVTIYKPVDVLGIIVTNKELIHVKLQNRWNLFRISSMDTIKMLLTSILSNYLPADDPLLTSPVEVEVLYSHPTLFDFHEKKWESFGNEIKYKNRFFLNETIDLDLLKDLLQNFSKVYDIGKIFYRARISEKRGYLINEMGKPLNKATSGRANPYGIPYLYVSTKLETCIYESRASYLDYVCIGTFKLIAPLSVITLREISNLSPFVFGDNLENYIIHERYLYRLEQELSKPVRRFDKEIDYLPSEYLCEYVKSLGYDAIEYGSSLKDGGINLAIFNDAKLECRHTEVYEITSLSLNFNSIV